MLSDIRPGSGAKRQRLLIVRDYLAKMSLKTLPLLFINLGGEMMYILDQRLRAQNIPQEKAQKGLSLVLLPVPLLALGTTTTTSVPLSV